MAEGLKLWRGGWQVVCNVVGYMRKVVSIHPLSWDDIPGCAGCAMAQHDFGRSVKPISTRGGRPCPPNCYWHTPIFRPSNSPADQNSTHFFAKLSGQLLVIKIETGHILSRILITKEADFISYHNILMTISRF